MAKQEAVSLRISGMTCEDCAAKIEGKLKVHVGIVNAKVDFNSKLAEVVYNAEALSPDDICALPVFKEHYRADMVKAPKTQKKDAPPSFGRSDGGNGKFDLIVVGGGSGAFAAAIKASEMGAKVVKAREERGKKIITAEMPHGKAKDFWADELLVATGRRPNIRGIGLAQIGVALSPRGGIVVNEHMQTAVPHIYAIGDCVDCDCPAQFVYVAAMQGAIAAQNALNGNSPRKMDYSAVPHAIFTTPEVAGVGLKEEDAKKQGYKVKTSLLDFHWVPRAEVMLDERGIVKMVAEADTLRILGVNIVASNAGDLIHEAVLAVKYKLTAQDLIDTLHVYPTLSEALRICAQGFFKDVTKLSCCAE